MKKPRKQSEVEEIQNRILEKALDIIVLKGFSSLTMRAIASKTGMTAPNIYNYFSSKDAIYITLVIRGFESLQQKLTRAMAPSLDPVGQARAFMEAYLDFGMENPSYYDIMFTRPTPKYNDYVGTPHEALSEVELRISMDIVDLAGKVIQAVFPDLAWSQCAHRLIAVWSLLHGMVTLNNSQVASYVVPDVAKAYRASLDEVFRVFVHGMAAG